jgi:hypothetical protein
LGRQRREFSAGDEEEGDDPRTVEVGDAGIFDDESASLETSRDEEDALVTDITSGLGEDSRLRR